MYSFWKAVFQDEKTWIFFQLLFSSSFFFLDKENTPINLVKMKYIHKDVNNIKMLS